MRYSWQRVALALGNPSNFRWQRKKLNRNEEFESKQTETNGFEKSNMKYVTDSFHDKNETLTQFSSYSCRKYESSFWNSILFNMNLPFYMRHTAKEPHLKQSSKIFSPPEFIRWKTFICVHALAQLKFSCRFTWYIVLKWIFDWEIQIYFQKRLKCEALLFFIQILFHFNIFKYIWFVGFSSKNVSPKSMDWRCFFSILFQYLIFVLVPHAVCTVNFSMETAHEKKVTTTTKTMSAFMNICIFT